MSKVTKRTSFVYMDIELEGNPPQEGLDTLVKNIQKLVTTYLATNGYPAKKINDVKYEDNYDKTKSAV